MCLGLIEKDIASVRQVSTDSRKKRKKWEKTAVKTLVRMQRALQMRLHWLHRLVSYYVTFLNGLPGLPLLCRVPRHRDDIQYIHEL